MKKIFYFLSNRCSYSRSKALLERLDKKFDLTLIVTGQLLDKGFEDVFYEIYKKFNICTITPCDSNKNTLSGAAEEFKNIYRESLNIFLEEDHIDMLVLWADRYELLPIACAASFLNIKITHIQAFENSGNIDDKVRNAVSSLADIHFVSHLPALLKGEAFGYNKVYDTGCPCIELLPKPIKKKDRKDHVIMMYHPVTTEIESIGEQVASVLRQIINICYDNRLKLYVFQPNNDPGHIYVHSLYSEIKTIQNMPSDEFNKLLASAKMIVGNTSACIRESSYLGIPAVLIGSRQNNRVHDDNIILCPDYAHAQKCMKKALKLDPKSSTLFGNNKSSEKIVKIIEGELHGRS